MDLKARANNSTHFSQFIAYRSILAMAFGHYEVLPGSLHHLHCDMAKRNAISGAGLQKVGQAGERVRGSGIAS
ncbi:hypothetical protein [Stutzerimonas nitrititolerans]|uniref:hypothetical protein n=1 Tax=Stutzerimonas nitrititolerans TaxID=2482751 RepID=UPI00289F90AA|nr:hypothetical protein [Stutzerimonas nitrititolerans]